MAFNYCFLLLTLLPFCSAKDTVPTLLIDYEQVMNHLFVEQSPFSRTSASRFADIVEDAVSQSSVIIIFVEDSLCTEDLSLKDENGTPFQNLREHLLNYKVKYLPNVVNPVKLLSRLLEPTDFNVFVLKPDQDFKPSENMRFFYVFLKDDSKDDRISALRRHDKVIQEVYETTRKIANGAVVAFYTAKVNPVTFSTYDYGPTDVLIGSDPRDVTMASFGAMLRFKGLSIDETVSARRRSLEAEIQDAPRIIRNQRAGNETTTQVAVGKYYMHFTFTHSHVHWTLESIELMTEDASIGVKYLGVKVPKSRSFYCDEPLVFYCKLDNSTIIIPEWQVQPFTRQDMPSTEPPTTSTTVSSTATIHKRALLAETAPDYPPENKTEEVDIFETIEFGPPVMCTNYFNIGILTGLSVTILILTVVGVAVYGLYHIETNDRFEDPHGKPFYTLTTE